MVASNAYEKYYITQAGNGLPVFRGAPVQGGYGLGNIFAGIGRAVLPLLKQGAKAIGKEALNSGSQFVGDILGGKNIKKAAIQRSKQAGKSLLSTALGKTQHINRKRQRKQVSSKKVKRRKVTKDIFS